MKMTMDEFKEYMVENIKDYLPKEYVDAEISIVKIHKNNNLVLDSLLIRNPSQSVTPNIYLNELYRDYEQGKRIEDVAQQISEAFMHGIKNQISVEKMDFDSMKDNIILRIVGSEKNQNLIDNIPFKKENDLLVTFRWLVQQDENGIGSALIKNKIFKEFGIDKDELYDIAKKNTQRLFPAKVSSMEDMLSGLMQNRTDIELFDFNTDKNTLPMYIVTNESGINGATTMLYPDVLDKLSEKLGGNLFILPSSTHEVIVVPATNQFNIQELAKMVKDINEDIVLPEEVLSNNIYQYDAKGKSITIVNNLETSNEVNISKVFEEYTERYCSDYYNEEPEMEP